jgi:hypothetical protein
MVSFFAMLFLVACGKLGTPQEPRRRITVYSARVVPGSHIEFKGQSTLSNNTCLQTQLLADDAPLAWWPKETCVLVKNGAWQVSVNFGEKGVPQELSRGKQYILHVWERSNPWVEAEPFWFDLSGPPE